MKPQALCKMPSSGIELWRAQEGEDPRGVLIDFTIPGVEQWVSESWSVEPDPRSRARDAYVARKVDRLKKSGFIEVTSTEFDRAVARRAKQRFDERPYVRSPAAAKRSKQLLRYLKESGDGTIRFVAGRGNNLQWWCISFVDKLTLRIDFTEAHRVKPLRSRFHLSDSDGGVLQALDELEAEYCMEQVTAIQRSGYRHVSAAQFARAQATRAKLASAG